MKPETILAAKGFKSTSGNRVIHVTDLGLDGMHATWDLKPSDQDCEEFERHMGTVMGQDLEVTRHNGGLTDAQLAYKKWEKRK